MVRPSGPAALELPLSRIAFEIRDGEKGERYGSLSRGCALLRHHLTSRTRPSEKWGEVEVNCLSKTVAISRGLMRKVELNYYYKWHRFLLPIHHCAIKLNHDRQGAFRFIFILLLLLFRVLISVVQSFVSRLMFITNLFRVSPYVVSPSLRSCFIILLVELKNWRFLLLSKVRSVRMYFIVSGSVFCSFHMLGIVPLTYSVHV